MCDLADVPSIPLRVARLLDLPLGPPRRRSPRERFMVPHLPPLIPATLPSCSTSSPRLFV
jgi:hypothetical protein